MTRPNASDRACLDAQIRAQVEQKLNGERARDTERCPPPSEPSWAGEGSSIRCPICDSAPGEMCSWDGVTKPQAHWLRSHRAEQAKTPSASDCAPPDPPGAPDADCSGVAPSRGDSGRLLMPVIEVSKEELRELYPEPPRPVCACGQEIRHKREGLELGIGDERVCNDCFAANLRTGAREGLPLDQRIREAQSDSEHECAWSTPTSDGEGWR